MIYYFDFQAMDINFLSKKPLITITCLTFMAVCNFSAFIHFLTKNSTTRQNLESKTKFISNYTFYIFCQGVLVPVILILSISSFRKFAKQRCHEKFDKLNEIFVDWKRRRNRIDPIFR